MLGANGTAHRSRTIVDVKQRSPAFDENAAVAEVGADLTKQERELLSRGVIEWGGPARCTEELAVAMGFASVADLFTRSEALIAAIESGSPLTAGEWVRVLLLTEIVFASDVLGSGRDWPTTTGLKDAETLVLLRSVQRKILRREHRLLIGNGFGTRPPKRRPTQGEP